MYANGKSDKLIRARKQMNKSYQRSKEERQRLAESVEQRGLAEGNTPQPTTTGTQRPDTVSSGLQRVREAAQRDNYAVPYNLV